MSKRLQCKLKYEEDEKAAAHVFQDFITTFQSNPRPNKVFIKSATLNAKNEVEANSERGRIYRPLPIIPECSSASAKTALECAKLVRDDIFVKSSKGNGKPKSNLDSLKEELKQRHSERILRKNTVASNSDVIKPSSNSSHPSLDGNCMKQTALDENDTGTIRTTNLFINNLRPTLTENDLMVLFGEYGPLASVKIMWPRSNVPSGNSGDEDDRRGNVNCGFVAFMSRKDSERALECMTVSSDMRISWGRPVDLPSFPVYIPPRYQKLLMPPSYTGFPFNAQPIQSIKQFINDIDMQDLLYNSSIKVAMPFEKKQIMTIHRMVEFVVREGPLFEAMIMNREMKNPLFEFLFENKSTSHAYYRWKLYSIAHGESTTNWSKEEFRMFKGGAVWFPPTVPNFFQGMPDYLCEGNSCAITCDLSHAQETRLIHFIQNMRMTQQSIREVTVYCLNHAKASRPIVDIVCTSLLHTTSNATYKIARLYLLNDILHNVWQRKDRYNFLPAIDRYLNTIMDSLQTTYWNLRFDHDRVQFKKRIDRIFRAWTCWNLFTVDRMAKWEQLFADKDTLLDDGEQDALEEYPLDGKRLRELSKTSDIDFDYDGVQIDCMSTPEHESRDDYGPEHKDFITSRWEAVDPMEIEASAMSAKRLYFLENNRIDEQERSSHNKTVKTTNTKSRNTSKPYNQDSSESLRSRLRDIELQVLQFQDDLESGKIKPKRCRKQDEEVLNFRRKLMKKLSLESVDVSYN